MEKILLYYKYVLIKYPKQIMKWMKIICEDLDLKGRIIIGNEGINGTVGGSDINTQRYKKIMSQHELFNDIDFKESPGNSDSFPKMSIKVRDEIVRLGIPTEKLTTKNTGQHLKPEQAHELIEQKPDDLVIFDARNNYEWTIGRFENAITPDIDNFRDLPAFIDQNLDQFKDKQILMYCTGGIRCERASAYLNEKGVAKQVYQLEGGIQRYTDKYPEGFFRGKNYVFDNRISVKINADILASCELCNKSCDEYINCINARCNKQFVCCTNCVTQFDRTCGINCQKLVQENKVNIRPGFEKIDANLKTNNL